MLILTQTLTKTKKTTSKWANKRSLSALLKRVHTESVNVYVTVLPLFGGDGNLNVRVHTDPSPLRITKNL